MSLEAYQKTQTAAETPSDTEYRLFSQVTRSLIDARDKKATGIELVQALDWNRRLWSTLSTDCGAAGNKLPESLRAAIISLSIWVSRYSSEVARRKADIDALIDVNRSIMEGLAMQREHLRKAATPPTAPQSPPPATSTAG